MFKRVGTVAAIAVCAGACATITRGSVDQIQIQSSPPGVMARLSTGTVCMTPCTIPVGRKDEFSVMFQKEGFEDQVVEVKTAVQGAGGAGFAGNVLIGGLIGMGVDASTGAAYDHVPNPVSALMIPKAAPIPPPTASNSKKKKEVVSQ